MVPGRLPSTVGSESTQSPPTAKLAILDSCPKTASRRARRESRAAARLSPRSLLAFRSLRDPSCKRRRNIDDGIAHGFHAADHDRREYFVRNGHAIYIVRCFAVLESNGLAHRNLRKSSKPPAGKRRGRERMRPGTSIMSPQFGGKPKRGEYCHRRHARGRLGIYSVLALRNLPAAACAIRRRLTDGLS